MSINSNDQGRAYEYAWAMALLNRLETTQDTELVHNSSLYANERAWNAIGQEKQALFSVSANAAVDTILELEPLMEEKSIGTLSFEFQGDEAGKLEMLGTLL